MDEDRKEITRRILDFTLEIIYLLTGEDYTIVKKTSGDCVTPIIHLQESGGWRRSHFPITDPPPHSPIHDQKILELTHKMMELLTGEVPIRCQDVAVYFSMEEWEYIEGHWALYENIMMEDHRDLTSQDGSSRRNFPERCSCPLFSQDCPEEDPNVQENHQGENLIDIKIEVIEEDETDMRTDQQDGSSRRKPPERCPHFLYSQDGQEGDPNVPEDHLGEDLTDIKVKIEEEQMMGDHSCMRDVKEEIPVDIIADGSSRTSPERCPHPLYSQDSPEEDPNMPKDHQGEDLTDIKVEVEEERMMDDHPCMRDVKEKIPVDVTAENSSKSSEENVTLSVTHNIEDEDNPQHSSGENLITLNVPPGLHSTDLSYKPSNHEERSPDASQNVTTSVGQEGDKRFQCGEPCTKSSGLFKHRRIYKGEKAYSCSECGKCFIDESNLVGDERSCTGAKPYSCSECGKCFTYISQRITHEKIHMGERPYPCSECGKCFTRKINLVMHERIHTGERPFPCSECGKSFTRKLTLLRHLRIHTGEKPFSCSECGKCFRDKSYLVIHEKSHTGEKLHSCSVCGKCFKYRTSLVIHKRIHTEEELLSCALCEKGFTDKSSLEMHKKIHTEGKLFSCLECGKCFTSKPNLAKHERIHTGEKPYSCSLCGKCFTEKSNLVKHERIHTREKPYSCSVCAKCFTHKSDLVKHRRIHTGENLYSCSECGKCFIAKAKLVIHERTHTGEKPYLCSFCGKCFTDKSTLVRHKRRHTEEKPY